MMLQSVPTSKPARRMAVASHSSTTATSLALRSGRRYTAMLRVSRCSARMPKRFRNCCCEDEEQ